MKKIYVFLGIAISLLCLYLAFYKVQWAEVGSTLRRANYLSLIAAIFFQLLSLAIAGFRWKMVINLPGVSWASTSRSMMVGLMINNLLPGRLGELVRPILLAREIKRSRSFLFATVVVDRLSDLLVLILLALISFSMVPSFPYARQISQISTIGGGIIILSLFLIGLLNPFINEEKLGRMARPFVPGRFYERVFDILKKMRLGFQTIQSPSRGIAIFGLSWAVWGAWFFCLFYGLRAFELTLSLGGMILLLAVLNLGGLIPSSPGYAGTYHFLAILILANLGVRKEEALSFILVFHALWYIPQTFIGLLILIQKNLKFWSLIQTN